MKTTPFRAAVLLLALNLHGLAQHIDWDWHAIDSGIEMKVNGSIWRIESKDVPVADADCGIRCEEADRDAVYRANRTCVGKCSFRAPRILSIDYQRQLMYVEVATDYRPSGRFVIYQADPRTRTIRRVAKLAGSAIAGGLVSPDCTMLSCALYSSRSDCAGNIRAVVVRIRDGASAVVETPTTRNRDLQSYMSGGLRWIDNGRAEVKGLVRTMAACAANDQKMRETNESVDVTGLVFSQELSGAR